MNFLKMAQDVRHLSGVQGTGPSTVDTTAYDQIFVSTVRNVWIDIQNSKKTWKWMRTSGTLILQVGKNSYTPAEVFGPTNRFKRYYLDTFYIEVDGKKSPLRFINYELFVSKYLNDTDNGVPYEFSIRPQDNAIMIKKPNNTYNVYFDYHKNTQILTLATDVPECSSDYHNMIVYAGVASYCLSMGIPQLQQEYSQRFTETYDQMVRDRVPREIFKVSGIV